MNTNRRSTKYVKPRMQGRGILVGGLVAAIVLVVQAITVTYSLNRISDQLPRDGSVLLEALPGLMIQNLVISAAVLLPILFLIGLNVTHRVAGPLYRIEGYLQTMVDGRDPGELRSRKSDELQDLCAVVNRLRSSLYVDRESIDGDAATALDAVDSLAQSSESESKSDAA